MSGAANAASADGPRVRYEGTYNEYSLDADGECAARGSELPLSGYVLLNEDTDAGTAGRS